MYTQILTANYLNSRLTVTKSFYLLHSDIYRATLSLSLDQNVAKLWLPLNDDDTQNFKMLG